MCINSRGVITSSANEKRSDWNNNFFLRPYPVVGTDDREREAGICLGTEVMLDLCIAAFEDFMAFTFFLFERASIDDKKPSAVSLKRSEVSILIPSEVSVLIPPLTSCDEKSSSKMEVDSESRMRVRKTAMTAKTKKFFVIIIIMLILSVIILVWCRLLNNVWWW